MLLTYIKNKQAVFWLIRRRHTHRVPFINRTMGEVVRRSCNCVGSRFNGILLSVGYKCKSEFCPNFSFIRFVSELLLHFYYLPKTFVVSIYNAMVSTAV